MPAIIITLKPLAQRPVNKPYTFWHRPRGYDTSIEFYNPVYETPEQKNNPKRDLRTTLYWNPSVRIDSLNIDSLNFYMNDISNRLRFEIQGVTAEGVPLYFEQIIGQETKSN